MKKYKSRVHICALQKYYSLTAADGKTFILVLCVL